MDSAFARQIRYGIIEGSLRAVGSYVCAPSESAMNGSKDQSFSATGSVPSSPMESSISGPLW